MTERRPPSSAAAGNDPGVSPGTDDGAGGADDDGPWHLAASFPGLSGDDINTTYEGLRELSNDEFSAISAATDLLNRLTVSSPHQRLVHQYEILADALEDVAGDSSETLNARLARSQEALRAWARQAGDLPTAVQDVYGELVRARTMSALGSWRDDELGQFCGALAERGLVARPLQNELVAVLPGASVELPARTVPIHDLIGDVLSKSERLHFHVLLDSEGDLHDASRRLRALEGEVLLGTPLLLRMVGTQLQLQGMHNEVRIIAETAVRAARAAIEAPSAERFGDTTAAPRQSAPGTAANGATSEQFCAQTPPPTEVMAPAPPVDVSAVAILLSKTVAELEQVWADAVSTEGVLLASAVDERRFGGVMAALLRQTEEAELNSRTTGGKT